MQQMNEQIVKNLYEFWSQIGRITNKLTETDTYSTVSMNDSDWPNRVFYLKNNFNLNQILKSSQEEKLPEIITLTKPNDLNNIPDVEFVFGQKKWL